ncbi:hypothetical protein THAOC_30188, partial [Thalassiosira oceanica]
MAEDAAHPRRRVVSVVSSIIRALLPPPQHAGCLSSSRPPPAGAPSVFGTRRMRCWPWGRPARRRRITGRRRSNAACLSFFASAPGTSCVGLWKRMHCAGCLSSRAPRAKLRRSWFTAPPCSSRRPGRFSGVVTSYLHAASREREQRELRRSEFVDRESPVELEETIPGSYVSSKSEDLVGLARTTRFEVRRGSRLADKGRSLTLTEAAGKFSTKARFAGLPGPFRGPFRDPRAGGFRMGHS